MKLELSLTKAATRDLREAGNWYEENEPGLGDRYIKAVEKRFEDIRRDPLLFRVFSPRGARRCLVFGWPYMICYKISNSIIIVVAVIHTSRDPKYLNYRLR